MEKKYCGRQCLRNHKSETKLIISFADIILEILEDNNKELWEILQTNATHSLFTFRIRQRLTEMSVKTKFRPERIENNSHYKGLKTPERNKEKQEERQRDIKI